MKEKNFYITTTLPYVNAEPHVGFAMEIIRADVIARAKKIEGYNVFMNTGTDEHGLKIDKTAKSLGISTKDYVDKIVEKFNDLIKLLGINDDIHFIRTTDENHIKSAQEFWKICKKNGYIYKKNYKVKYCVGCELEKTESELVDGKCTLHPSLNIEEIDEDNYFFKFSDFQNKLLELYEENPDFVVPDYRLNEIKVFVERGLQDFSISRLKSKMPWGIEVPDDDEHVMFVWFDALINYISTIGWPDDKEEFKKWWNTTGGVVQYCGKDNLRQQSAMWQAMLMSVGLPPSKQIIINGFITGDGGIKMSKSLGNTINPLEIIEEYGKDALRFFLLKEINPFEDSPFTIEKFKEAYNAYLANGLGNLVSRVIKMAENSDTKFNGKIEIEITEECKKLYDKYEINKVCDLVWDRIHSADKYIQENEPFKVIKIDIEKGKGQISYLLEEISEIASMLYPILPETSDKIIKALKENRITEPLFMRK